MINKYIVCLKLPNNKKGSSIEMHPRIKTKTNKVREKGFEPLVWF